MSTCNECGEKRRGSGACEACGVAAAVADATQPRCSVLFTADFADHGDPRGFHIHSTPRHTRIAGPPSELGIEVPETSDMINLVSTSEHHPDGELGVSVRFTEEPRHEHDAFGIEVRASDLGDYVVRVAWSGAYAIGYHEGEAWGGYLVPWTRHAAIVRGVGPRNRLRVAVHDDSLRVVVNGVHLATVPAVMFTSGTLRVIGAPHGHGLRMALSALQLRSV